MASNLKSAKQAIEAELSHAKQGIAYYTARVKALESTLHQLESVEGDGSTSTRGEKPQANAKAAKRGRKPRGAASAIGADQSPSAEGTSRKRSNKAKRSPRSRTTDGSNAAAGLPSTGSNFWLSLVSNQPQSAVDIANAASAALGIKPDQKKQIQKLKQRVSPALAGLVSAQKIKDSGSGRERRFFKNDNQSA